MPRMISLDIGFDRKALSKPDGSGEVPLQLGMTTVDEKGNPVYLARKLKPGDRLLITLYDLTEAKQEPSPVNWMSFKIAFQKAREGSPDSPAEKATYQRFEVCPGPLSPGYSTVFEGHFPNWNVHRSDKGGRPYPKNQLAGPQPPREAVLLEHEGYFYFTLFLHVAWKGEDGEPQEKYFRDDPEIILSNNGTPDPDGKGGS